MPVSCFGHWLLTRGSFWRNSKRTSASDQRKNKDQKVYLKSGEKETVPPTLGSVHTRYDMKVKWLEVMESLCFPPASQGGV